MKRVGHMKDEQIAAMLKKGDKDQDGLVIFKQIQE